MIPPPQITCIADGRHIAVCPECSAELPVLVKDVPGPSATLPDMEGNPVQVALGHTSEYDLSEYERHYEQEHLNV